MACRESSMAPVKSNELVEAHGIRLLGIVAIALIVIIAGIWVWKSSLPVATYSELIFISSPADENNGIIFSVQLNSFESKDLRVDVNAYFNGELVSRKKVELDSGQQKAIRFSIPVQGSIQSDVEVVVKAQRFLEDGNAFKSVLEVRDWLLVQK